MITTSQTIIIEEGAYSVDLNGVDEQFLELINRSMGFGNAWSIGLWIKPRAGAVTGNDVMLNLKQTTSNNVLFMSRGGASNGQIRWLTTANGGANLKTYDWLSILEQDVWQFHVCTWNGTNMLAYVDGIDLGPPDVAAQDNAGAMADTNRNTAIGGRTRIANEFDGCVHSCMMWNVPLTPDALLALHNNGNGAGFNPLANSGNYQSSGNLQHFWKFGRHGTDLAEDYTLTRPPMDLMWDAVNITVDDIVADGPQG